MTINNQCPSCRKWNRHRNSSIGQSLKCKYCGIEYEVTDSPEPIIVHHEKIYHHSEVGCLTWMKGVISVGVVLGILGFCLVSAILNQGDRQKGGGRSTDLSTEKSVEKEVAPSSDAPISNGKVGKISPVGRRR